MGNNFLESIKETFKVNQQDIRSYSPLALAYIGDAVFDLVIRSVIVERANRSAAGLHKMAVAYVKAPSQAKMADALWEEMTQEEKDVYMRGRNANSHTTAKNASRTEYRKATGLEAVVGYLYLCGRTDRVLELIRLGLAGSGMEI